MKIIFDNEKQKSLIMRVLSTSLHICPSDLGYDESPVSGGDCDMECDICWLNCGIEMDVVGNE